MAEEKEEKTEKQKPVKPKKAGGEIDMKKVLIIIAASMIAQVIIIIVLIKFVFPPSPQPVAAEEGENQHTEQVGDEDVFDDENLEYFKDEDKVKYTSIEFDPIITKDFEWAIVLRLGFKIEEITQGEEEEESGGNEEGDGFTLPPKLVSETKSKVNEFFGDRSIGQIKRIPRDSIRIKIRNDLRPMFKGNDYLLRSITLEQFTPTKLN